MSESKQVVDAIVDEQLEAAKLAEEAYQNGKDVAGRLMDVARKVMAARAQGKVTAQRAKQLLREAFVLLTLNEYTDRVGPIQTMVDSAIDAQQEAMRAYGKPLSTVPVIRNADIKARDNERRGILNDQGAVDGNG